MTIQNKESINRPKFLFFGELPPAVVHGVSLSNKINTDILRELGELHIVEEEWDLSVHGQFSMKKVISVLKAAAKIWKRTRNKKYNLYYTVLSVSLFGALKQFLFVTAIRVNNKNTAILYHVHRSDLNLIMRQSLVFRAYISWLNQMNSGFILLSEAQKTECKDLLERTYVLYNCIDEKEVYPIETEKKQEMVRFLFLSNYMKEKGILDLLKAFRLLEDVYPIQLDCYGGDTVKNVKHDIFNIAQGVKWINIHGPVYGEEKNIVLNRADILVLPSYNEGFPLLVIEALRLNKPVIVTKVGYIEEILGDQYPLYCKAGDIQSIKKSIKKALLLLHSKELKEKLSRHYMSVSQEKHRIQLKNIITDSLN